MKLMLSHGLRMVAIGVYEHFCPGCQRPHRFNLSSQDHPKGLKFSFNGDLDKPTFSPANVIDSDAPIDSDRFRDRCHYYLTSGELQYLGDCTHAYRNQSVPLPPFPPRDRA